MELNTISLDASTKCQLSCPECSNTKGIIKDGIIGYGFLKFSDFKDLISYNPMIKHVELSNWGEIFLNPELESIVEFAYHKNIKLSAGNGVNFNNVSESVLESLVRYKFSYLNISIDGASQSTYSLYRVNGNFEDVISTIKKLNNYKLQYNSLLPKLSWQFIIFGHNEHEILEAKELSQQLNMVFIPKLNYSSFSPVKNPSKVKSDSGLIAASRSEYKAVSKSDYKRPCCQLWFSPQISWDGKVLGCCVNKWISFGNAFMDGLDSVLHSRKYLKTLDVLKGKVTIDDSVPCSQCPTYESIKSSPITDNELKKYSVFIHPAERQ